MKKAVQLAAPSIYQLKITLKHSNPPIWRRIQVRGDVTLAKLHRIFQAVMGWYDSHLHQFMIGKTYYGVPDPDDFTEVKDERKARLGELVSRLKETFLYEYDFGDGWEHTVMVEEILNLQPGVHYPNCMGGARACPPEDCGGISGYENFLEAIRDPDHEEHGEMLEWIGGEFEPEEFDAKSINLALKRIR
jgi:pRiA4b ORF-3-like protein